MIGEYAGGGHGAADEPLAAHTVIEQVDCYTSAEVGRRPKIAICGTGDDELLCVYIRPLGDLSFLSGTPEGSFWTVVSIFGHSMKS